jgi:L-alanine-DL-glutamate epimerase-like enolase superfamily enzyme
LLWLEEPIPPKNIAALANLTASASVPICVGENLYTRFEFRELFEGQAANIIMPDVQKTGGILESKRIADLASTYYIPMAPHCVTSPIGTMASVHLCASISNFLILEYHMIDVPWWADLALSSEPIVQNGYIQVPEKPGLGIELDGREVTRYLRQGETW